MVFEEKYINQNIERLDIPVSEINILKENNIKTLGNLCNYSKTDLKEFKILPNNINKIQIELQLLGLNLRGGL